MAHRRHKIFFLPDESHASKSRMFELFFFWRPKCNNYPKCNKVLNVITFGPKCIKVLNVIIFGPKCNKRPMQLLNSASVLLLEWTSSLSCWSNSWCTQKILWPIFMAYCGLSDINQCLFICYRRKSRSIGHQLLYWGAFGIKLKTSKQRKRWLIPLFISFTQTI